ncbi:MAG TPA: hypothetical protein VLZ83_01370 [Edaphocola sp.]|nr:hypothetical protein [Edaphocola sp.]
MNRVLRYWLGLQEFQHAGSIVEYAEKLDEKFSNVEVFQNYRVSLGFALNYKEMDTEEF